MASARKGIGGQVGTGGVKGWGCPGAQAGIRRVQLHLRGVREGTGPVPGTVPGASAPCTKSGSRRQCPDPGARILVPVPVRSARVPVPVPGSQCRCPVPVPIPVPAGGGR